MAIGIDSPSELLHVSPGKLTLDVSSGAVFQAGVGVDATGDFAVAMGYATTASGRYSFSMGYSVDAVGDGSTAF